MMFSLELEAYKSFDSSFGGSGPYFLTKTADDDDVSLGNFNGD